MKKIEIINKIKELVKGGLALKEACGKIGENNTALVLKYQRWYLEDIRENRMKSVKITHVKKENILCDNVVEFKSKPEGLSELDLQNLFVGVMKLIKKSVLQEAASKLDKEKATTNFLLKKAMLDINQKEEEIIELKREIKSLKLGEKTKLMKKNFEKIDGKMVEFKK